MRFFRSILFIVLSAVVFIACGNDTEREEMMENQDPAITQPQKVNDEDAMQTSESIVALASENQDLSTFTQALNAVDRIQMLKRQGPYTVFAPTNDAFDALPEGTVEKLMQSKNKGKLTNILAYHVVADSLMTPDLKDGQTLTTVQGGAVKITKKDGEIMISGANVTKTDIKASNGVIHVIDKVLIPSK